MNQTGAFFWNELMTPDVEGAKAFYGRVLGWEAKTVPMPGPEGGDYTEFLLAGMPVGGAMTSPEPGIPPHWMAYIRVEDADAAAAAAIAAGGQVCQAAFDVPEVGRIAVLQDPAGAVFAVIAPAPELLAEG